jgi:acyl-homoserine-lactone acylase
MKHVILLALVLTLPALGAPNGRGAEILFDTYGVPHIFAKDAEGLFYAFGWAQAHSHANLLLRLYGQARGRGAEYWGKEYLNADRWVRVNGVPKLAADWRRAQKPEFRAYLDAFAAGINAYARERGERIDEKMKIVLPVEGVDVLAHNLRVIHFNFVASPGLVMRWQPATGSNTWAIGPSRSAGKRAMLLANPHLPWSDFFTFYEAQLAGPGFDVYGATLVGLPYLAIAFNDNLGWSHTVNTYDGADLYELTLDGDGYRFDGARRAFESDQQVIKVRQPDGAAEEQKLVVKRSLHGPIVAERAGKALALRVAGLDQPHVFEQYWDMGRSKNLKEFERAVSRLQIPMFTVMYADRDGRIMHLFGGRVPVRPKGDWDYWSGVVPGDTSATLWTQTHRYEELPRVVDPPSGWLQNANDPPWSTTFPPALDPAKFPPYMAPRFNDFRPQRSARMLDEDSSVTFEELIEYKHSTRMELADRILGDVLAAARGHGGPTARKAAEVLEKWDRSADALSRGAVLFEAFYRELWRRSGTPAPPWSGKPGPFARGWSEQATRTTPSGLASPATAAAALEAAAAEVEMRYGAIDVPWGEVYRFRRGDVDLPANGGGGQLGIFRVMGYTAQQGKMVAASGDTYVAAIEFTRPVRARVLIGYGNSSQPGSPHLADQLPFLANKELRPAWRTRKEIEAHLEERKAF